jgi:hypothetical protein
MSVWMELMCDQRLDWPANAGKFNIRCFSQKTASPGAMAHNTAVSISRVYADLAADARSHGWRRGPRGWWCPGCLASPVTDPDPEWNCDYVKGIVT